VAEVTAMSSQGDHFENLLYVLYTRKNCWVEQVHVEILDNMLGINKQVSSFLIMRD
jgi:hypothetical protein